MNREVALGWLVALGSPAMRPLVPLPALALVCAAGVAGAQPAHVAVGLEYQPAKGCPELRDAVAALMGYDPFTPKGSGLVRASIARDARGFVAFMEHRDAAGHVLWSRRGLAEPDCRKLVDVMALVLTPEIEPLRAPATPPPPPPVVEPPPPALPAPAQPPTHASLKLRVGASAGANFGIAPATAAELAAQVGLRWRVAPKLDLSLALEGRGHLPAEDAQVRSRFGGGSLVPCVHVPLPLESWNVAGCGLLTLGLMVEEGVPPASATFTPHTAFAFYGAAGLRAALEIPVGGPVYLRVNGDVAATFVGPGDRLGGVLVWHSGYVSGAIGGGALVEF